MANKRYLIENGTYHVYTRGNNHMVIFREDFDKFVFLKKLKMLKDEFDFSIIAYCIMSNHIHLEFKDNGITLPVVMNSLLDYYAKFYNAKYKHNGHVFEGPYKSKIVLGDKYEITLLRYILRNPVAAEMVNDVFVYRWASYDPSYDIFSLIDFPSVMKLYKKHSKTKFVDFLRNNEDDAHLYKMELIRLQDTEAEELFKRITAKYGGHNKYSNLSEEQKCLVIQQGRYQGISVRQLCKFTELTKSVVNRICAESDMEYL